MAQTFLSSALTTAKDNPEETTTLAGHGGGLLQGISPMLGEGLSGQYSGGAGNLLGGVSNLVGGGSNFMKGDHAGGLGDMASGVTSLMSLAPSLMEHAPMLGMIGGGAQTIGHGMEMVKHSDKINDPYADNKFWQEAGSTGLSAMNTVASMDPTGMSTLAATGTQALVDTVGMGSGYLGKKMGLSTDTSFNSASLLGHAGHAVYDTASTLGSAGKWGLGKLGSGASWLYNQMPSLAPDMSGLSF